MIKNRRLLISILISVGITVGGAQLASKLSFKGSTGCKLVGESAAGGQKTYR